MSRLVWAGFVVTATIWAATAAADQPISAEPSGKVTPRRYGRIHTTIHDRILQRKVVRAPSRRAIDALVSAPGNDAARRRGTTVVQRLERMASTGQAKRGERRGYGAADVEFKARGLANTLGLSRGTSIQWNTRREQKTLRVESHGRAVLTSRPHDRYMTLLGGAVDRIVARIVQNPDARLSTTEQRRLAMAPTDMRAEALQKAGHKLKREQRGKELKYKLEFAGEHGLKIFRRVMGPGVSTYLPGRGHSQYLHDGQVLDTYMACFEPLRTTSRTVYPVMLGLGEAKRMDLLARQLVASDEQVTGYAYAHGRPPGYWPPRPGKDSATGNTCTTTHHRAPVGARLPAYAWLDALDHSGLVHGSLLAHISSAADRRGTIAGLTARARGTTRQQLKQLGEIVAQYDRIGLTKFPLQLLGRKQIKDLLGKPYRSSAPGTTDPVGPGYARGLYSAAAERVPVVVKLNKWD